MRIALVGAGIMGRQHLHHLKGLDSAVLCAVADPAPQSAGFAAQCGVEWFADTAQMLAAAKPDGVIIANPNTLHVITALTCLAAGVPVLLEKPVGVDLTEVCTLVAASRDSGVPVLVGHHRRHNPLIVRAHELVHSGALGRLSTVILPKLGRKLFFGSSALIRNCRAKPASSIIPGQPTRPTSAVTTPARNPAVPGWATRPRCTWTLC